MLSWLNDNLTMCICPSGFSTAVSLTRLHACMLSHQLCPTLCNPMDYSLPDSSVHGILQVRMIEWVDIPFTRGFSQPRDRTHVSCVSCTASRFFTVESPGKPLTRLAKHLCALQTACRKTSRFWELCWAWPTRHLTWFSRLSLFIASPFFWSALQVCPNHSNKDAVGQGPQFPVIMSLLFLTQLLPLTLEFLSVAFLFLPHLIQSCAVKAMRGLQALGLNENMLCISMTGKW